MEENNSSGSSGYGGKKSQIMLSAQVENGWVIEYKNDNFNAPKNVKYSYAIKWTRIR